ncbi:MAG: DUF3299 domain-containing protein [Deltaproteobacteria bacterium]|jgi:hypothetical protein|nr:DUF3299 domain-containing protein [Deltaproteobacteria bacterium]
MPPSAARGKSVSTARFAAVFAVAGLFFLFASLFGPTAGSFFGPLSGPSAALAQKKADYRDKGWLIWDELVDPAWDPETIFQDLKVNEMTDDDPRVDEIIEEFLRRWNDAPINEAMDGEKIKIPGFVVPLDFEETRIREFFLVPFFGACIHVPPPPPNQIIYVKSEKGLKGMAVMDVVWVYGKIRTDRFESEALGAAGYTLPADIVEPYGEDG